MGFARAELEAMVEHWLDANRRAETAGDWKLMGECYTVDASYGWNVGPKDEFMAVGREEIIEFALGHEMAGLSGWNFPYEAVIIDEVQGMVMGLWRQVADATREDGSHYEIQGLGGSWFLYGGNMQWSWQRDFFDVGNAGALYLEMMSAKALAPGMVARIEGGMKGERQPGHYRPGTAAVGLWERPSP